MTSAGVGTDDVAASSTGRMGVTGAIALVALLALGIFASKASAEPLSMEFTEARANVGVQLFDDPLFEAPATARFEAQIDPGSGAITAGELTVPRFPGSPRSSPSPSRPGSPSTSRSGPSGEASTRGPGRSR